MGTSPRRAAMVVTRGDGAAALAQAVEGEAGYWPLPAFGTFRFHVDAMRVAVQTNEKNGLTAEDVAEIVASAPRAQNLQEAPLLG